MKYQAHLNQKYSQLCQTLGDLIIKQDQINEAIKATKKSIEMLNSSHPILAAVETELSPESENE